jgi:hypothetical protein
MEAAQKRQSPSGLSRGGDVTTASFAQKPYMRFGEPAGRAARRIFTVLSTVRRVTIVFNCRFFQIHYGGGMFFRLFS